MTFDNPDFDYDFDIAGVRFLSAASEAYPYQRGLSKVVKDQLDTSTEPGDNSLQGWWTRSQTDWSGGTGSDYMEPASNELVRRQFYDSAGVDVFHYPGYFDLLPSASLLQTRIGDTAFLARTVAGYAVGWGDRVSVYDADENASSVTVSGTVVGLIVAGKYLMVATRNSSNIARIYGYELDGFSSSSTASITISGFTGTAVMSWVKNRLLVSSGDKLWEIAGLNADVDVSTLDPVIDMKDDKFTFVNAVGTPTSIIVGGSDLAGSQMMALLLDDTGALPDLTSPIVVGELPNNERLWGLEEYLGAFIILFTSTGVRVGTIADGGGLVYGPLIGSPVPQEPTALTNGVPVSPVVAGTYDRFVTYPVADAGESRGGLCIIDLSVSDDEGRYAYANYTRGPASSGVCVAQLILDERSTVMVNSTSSDLNLLRNSDDNVLDTGFLHGSWIRFNTLEGKFFDEIKVTCDPNSDGGGLGGEVEVISCDDQENEVTIGVLTLDDPEGHQEETFKFGSSNAITDLAVLLKLTADTDDPYLGPVVAAWSLRAWPAVQNRGDSVIIPLSMWDFERDSLGLTFGREGYAKERWDALSSAITAGTAVAVVESKSGFLYTAIAEDFTLTQVSPPVGFSGFGGVAQVSLRTT